MRIKGNLIRDSLCGEALSASELLDRNDRQSGNIYSDSTEAFLHMAKQPKAEGCMNRRNNWAALQGGLLLTGLHDCVLI